MTIEQESMTPAAIPPLGIPTGTAVWNHGGMKKGTYFLSPLQRILADELGSENRIREASEWPPHCRMLVLLDWPFKHQHPLEHGVSFKEMDDPHYWKAEYSFEVEPGLWECLACAF